MQGTWGVIPSGRPNRRATVPVSGWRGDEEAAQRTGGRVRFRGKSVNKDRAVGGCRPADRTNNYLVKFLHIFIFILINVVLLEELARRLTSTPRMNPA